VSVRYDMSTKHAYAIVLHTVPFSMESFIVYHITYIIAKVRDYNVAKSKHKNMMQKRHKREHIM